MLPVALLIAHEVRLQPEDRTARPPTFDIPRSV